MFQHTLIYHFLEQSVKKYPDKIALVHEKTRATFSQINLMADKLAYFILDLGIKKGDRVTFIFDNSLEYVVSYYGALKAGCVVAPLSTELKPDSLRHILKELAPQIFIASPRFEKLIRDSQIHALGVDKLVIVSPKEDWEDTPLKVFTWKQIQEETRHSNIIPYQIHETDLACIIYTSGSTGIPKGVMLTHKNVVTNTLSICHYLELSNIDIQMIVLPFYYVMGKSLLNSHFAVGGSVVINNKFAFPATVLKQMVEEKVTGFSGVPSTFAYLLHRSPLKQYKDKLASLRYCSQAGGHMAKQTKLELREALPSHTRIYIMYGATEASARLSYLPPERYLEKVDSIGIPIPGVALKVLDHKGKELPAGEIGELVAQGPNIMQGYWRDPDTTAHVLDNKGYHTGDMAYRDDDGYFYITGRKDNQLKVGGHRINIQEIEDILIGTGYLVEAAVLGIPDKLSGNKLIALVVPKENGFQKEILLKESAKFLPKYKLPSDIKVVYSLPQTGSGKIDRNGCLALITKIN